MTAIAGRDPLPVALIAAVGRNRVIGMRNGLPWSLPSDLKHFRALTMGQPTLMGRRTFESIGRPLPGRHLVVVSADPAFAAEGVAVARTPESAVDLARVIGGERGSHTVMVAGGGLLYAALIGAAQRIQMTEVAAEPEGDTLFPSIDDHLWAEIERVPGVRTTRDDAAFAFVTYARRPGHP